MNRFLAAIPAIILAVPVYAADFVKYEKASFTKLVASGKPVFVHVHADWCPTCRSQLSAFPAAFKNAKDLNKVVVSYDNDVEFKRAHGVRLQSTLIVFRHGKEVARGVGTTDPLAIKALVDKAI